MVLKTTNPWIKSSYQTRRQELEAANNRFAIVLLGQLTVLETQQDSKARLKAKTALTRQLYEKGYSKQDIIRLFTLLDWLITLPKELEPIYNQAIKHIEEEKRMNYITTPQRIGRQEGIQQGESTILIRLLQRRFHSIPSTYLTQVMQADADTLLLWADRIFDAKTLDEVFAD